ncbi:hypothetical protein [Cyclobacterium sp. SYSU L10401]|uniref:hypothetical protein n=1 Tax=Cyclobacterium sp. SYSU L10401 TaxID=2678657 RepID=UPI0013D31AB0|nr:hypothetical protein [Cyclobacterium sp. SYSU L10401]
MSNFRLNLPTDIPWRLIANSSDMMDMKFCDGQLPPPWRSSIALSVFEPTVEDLPSSLCDRRLTYLKVSGSITGTQLESIEGLSGTGLKDGVPTKERLKELLGEYMACYGVLVNVAVHPIVEGGKGTGHYPRIIDFEPKRRDLYQAATESGEVLTASVNRLRLDKTFSHTESVETGLSLTASYEGKGQGSLSRAWGETTQDVRSSTRDAHQEERERFATTTHLNQMYNLLTGYHLGTNRSVFLMLPRPNTEQPSEHRTFAQGLRVIEGVQDFFLVVSRPRDSDGLRVEIQLETGHFPEDTTIEEPSKKWEKSTLTVTVDKTVKSRGRWGRERATRNFDIPFHGLEEDGWQFDVASGDRGKGGVEQILKSGDNADGSTGGRGFYRSLPAMENYDYGASSPGLVFVKMKLRSYTEKNTRFHRDFKVHLRREIRTTGADRADVGRLIVLGRSLCAWYRSADHCIEETKPDEEESLPEARSTVGILDELDLRIPKAATLRQDSYSEARATADAVGKALVSSWKMPSRRPLGETTLIDTDYIRDRLIDLVPEDRKRCPIEDVPTLSADVKDQLGLKMSVSDVLAMEVTELANQIGRSVSEAAHLRRVLMFPGAETSMKDGSRGPEQTGSKGVSS